MISILPLILAHITGSPMADALQNAAYLSRYLSAARGLQSQVAAAVPIAHGRCGSAQQSSRLSCCVSVYTRQVVRIT